MAEKTLSKYQQKKERQACTEKTQTLLIVGTWPDHDYMSIQEAYKAFCEKYDPLPIVVRR